MGAPKANVSALLADKIVNPGAVYKCDLKKNSCEQIPFEEKGKKSLCLEGLNV